MTKVAVVLDIALVMTVGIYGLVAGIVKLDDAGLHLLKRAAKNGGTRRIQAALGRALLGAAPYLMKTLSVVGTPAMSLVVVGILLHCLPGAQDLLHHVEVAVSAWPAGALWVALTSVALNTLADVLAGALALTTISMAA